ncbi:MAG: guanylate kinase [Coriobacteriales bacterium]|nr:guanylate kinase [Coriobacteriales bacterium]
MAKGVPSPGNLFVISGPSGVGKDTLVRRVLTVLPEARLSVSATTRAPRGRERDGVDYHFLSDQDFDREIAADGFLEHADYAHARYGTLRSEVEKGITDGHDVILVIEVQGAAQVKRKMPEAVLIFVAPPSLSELERRLRHRHTDDEAQVQTRLETARLELAQQKYYNHVLVNDDLNATAQRLAKIMRSYACH